MENSQRETCIKSPGAGITVGSPQVVAAGARVVVSGQGIDQFGRRIETPQSCEMGRAQDGQIPVHVASPGGESPQDERSGCRGGESLQYNKESPTQDPPAASISDRVFGEQLGRTMGKIGFRSVALRAFPFWARCDDFGEAVWARPTARGRPGHALAVAQSR